METTADNSNADEPTFEELSARHSRISNGVFALSAMAVLGIAAALPPDPTGMGTHTRLGLPGCTMLKYTGLPCPFCGMTTSFAHFAHGDPVSSFVAQPMGSVLFLVTLVGAAFFAWRVFTSHAESADTFVQRVPLWAWLTGAGMLLAGWAYKIAVVTA